MEFFSAPTTLITCAFLLLKVLRVAAGAVRTSGHGCPGRMVDMIAGIIYPIIMSLVGLLYIAALISVADSASWAYQSIK